MKFLPFSNYSITGDATDCPICKSSQFTSISQWDRRFKKLHQVKCDQCSLVRHLPLPDEAGLAKYYAEEYRSDYQNVSVTPTERHRRKRIREAERRTANLDQNLKSGMHLLDFGCGSGEFVEFCGQQGVISTGFEPGEAYSTYAREQMGLNVVTGAYQDLNFDEKFDVITSFHVFEHLVDPLNAIEKMKTWLKPDGKIFIEVPNTNHILIKGFGGLHFAHTIGFARYSLEYLGAVAGLKIADVFDEFDIGIIFEHGTPRELTDIANDGQNEMAKWTKGSVHKQYWRYTFSKLIGNRLTDHYKEYSAPSGS